MTALFIISALAFFALRGYVEGMVMESGGVRNAPGFAFYHGLAITRDTFLILTTLLAVYGHISNIYVIVGVMILGWEIFELAYCRSRYSFWIPFYENVWGTGKYIYNSNVKILHALRGFVGLALLIRWFSLTGPLY